MSLQQQLPSQCKSEVALLLERIELEYTAADRGLNGLSSGSSQHEVITKKMERLSDAVEQLKGEVGKERALELTIEIMEVSSDSASDSRASRSASSLNV